MRLIPIVFSFLALFLFHSSYSQCSFDLGADTSFCGNELILNLSTQLDFFEDSLSITYDASLGQTSLIGATKVYFHSAAEVTIGGGWEYVVGNWGMDDGVGEMNSVAPNIWKTTIHVNDYYGIPGANPQGIFIVFRDETGSNLGKDWTGNDIYIDLTGPAPVSLFNGVVVEIKEDGVSSIEWSTGNWDELEQTINLSGWSWAEVTDTSGCVFRDSIHALFSSPQPLLGTDTLLCDSMFSLDLNTGFQSWSYLWSTASTDPSISVNNEGLYWVEVTDTNGCIGRDTIDVLHGWFNVNLGSDTSLCEDSIYQGVELNLVQDGDSLLITYDATKGVSGLVGASKVYMHSGAEMVPFGGWEYTTGNWGIDDGVGLMTQIGIDLWQIKILPETYFGYPPGQDLNGVFFAFRNEDGTLTGRDDMDMDIYADMTSTPPNSTFDGITVTLLEDELDYQLWSTGESGDSVWVSSSGDYWIEVKSTDGCVLRDTVGLLFGNEDLDLGLDLVLCDTTNAILIDAGSGFDVYSWSTGGTSQIESVDAPMELSLESVDSIGCSYFDTIQISQGGFDLDLGNDTSFCSLPQFLTPQFSLSFFNDSLKIVYDATQGVSGLVGATKVYMHAGAELNVLGGWEYPKGNWGLDDGIGQMNNIGTDLWEITIEPESYFGYANGASMVGLFIVFRNEDGTLTGKNDLDTDIWVDMASNPPSSVFLGVDVSWKMDGISSINWSDGSTDLDFQIPYFGEFGVEVIDTFGCMVSDSITIQSGFSFVDLGLDTVICNTFNPFTLSATPGLMDYLWSTGDSTSSLMISGPGSYWVSVTDSLGCMDIDTINVGASSLQMSLGSDTVFCGDNGLIVPLIVPNPVGDSLVIIYDANLGQNNLGGANKIYFHSAMEMAPGNGWEYPVGNWGMDDGLGEMNPIGGNKWTITIHPESYFVYPANLSPHGLFMVFRNEDGTLLGKDDLNNDIWVDMNSNPPSSGFSGVSLNWKNDIIDSYLWSDGSFGSSLTVNSGGQYWLEVSDTLGCSFRDSVVVDFSPFQVNLGVDTQFCTASFSYSLDVGTSFDSIYWNTGANTSGITINSSGIYSVEVIDSFGCYHQDSITISNSDLVVSLGNDTSVCSTDFLLTSNINVDSDGDSLTLTFDASQGQALLSGSTIVYFHSGAEMVPFGGWEYVTGNWGQNDGIGQMSNIGPDLWQITISLDSYYMYPAGSSPIGIHMVFRNEDGSLSGGDDFGNDIYLDISSNTPSSSFLGLWADISSDAVSSYLWSDGSMGNSLLVATSGNYWLEVTDTNGCQAADSINVTFSGTTIDLGVDTVLCESAFSLAIDAVGNGPSTYNWSTGDTTQIIQVNSPGEYWVSVQNDAGCIGQDTILVSNSTFSVFLGNDTLTCGDSLFLSPEVTVLSDGGDSLQIIYDASKGASSLIGASKVYLHSTYETAPLLGPVIPWVGNWGLDDGLGQMDSLGGDLWTITILPQDYYSIPADSGLHGLFMVFRNEDGSLVGKDSLNNDIWMDLSGGNPMSAFDGVDGQWIMDGVQSYLWSDLSVSPNLWIATSGLYSVEITDTTGCSVSDSIFVDIVTPPTIELGPDFLVCPETYPLLIEVPNDYYSYLWSNGDTSSSTEIFEEGSYSLVVLDSNGCSGTDTLMVVNGLQNGSVNLGGDTAVCGQGNIVLNPQVEGTYLWSDNSSDSFLVVSDPGEYWVEVIDSAGCTDTDTISILIAALPEPDLGADLEVCDGQSVVLDPGGPFVTYLWSDSSTGTTLEVLSPGSYYVTVTNPEGCEGIDLVIVNIGSSPGAGFTFDNSNDLEVSFTSLATNYSSLSWDFDGDDQEDDNTPNPIFNYSQPGVYPVTLIAVNSCGSDTLTQLVVVELTGILDNKFSGINVFPNPTEGVVQIEFNNVTGRTYQYSLFNMLGQELLTAPLEIEEKQFQTEIDLREIPSGDYLIVLKSDESVFSRLIQKR